jgi:hypothetical protein
MFWILLVGILIPTILVALVLAQERYLPRLRRHRTVVLLLAGITELLIAVVFLLRGVSGTADWARIVSIALLGVSFIWLSRLGAAAHE